MTRTVSILAAATLALAGFGATRDADADAARGVVHGVRVAVQPAHASVPRARSASRSRSRRHALPHNARALRRTKAAAARRYRAQRKRSPSRPGAQIRRRPVVSGGLNWRGISQSASSPPDTAGAIGHDHYVEATNDGVAVYARSTGASVASTPLDAFLGVPGDDVTDPQVLWDEGTGRWFYAGLDVTTGSEQMLFGWSKTADPSDLAAGWCNFSLPTTGFADDFPKLGDSDTRILIGANRFDASDTFQTAVIYAIDKPAAGDISSCSAPPTPTRFGSSASPLTQTGGGATFTPVPANTTDASSAGYVVAADEPGNGSASHVEAFHVSGPPGSAALVRDGSIGVTSFAVPANAPQGGSSSVIDTSDARLTQAVAHVDPAVASEAVWTQHTVNGPGGSSVVRWYELLPSQLSTRQSGTVSETPDFAFNAAISPTLDGASAVIDYNASGPSSLPRVLARSHRSTATAGQMSAALPLVTSSAALADGSCSPCRWGDYAAATPDPLDSSLVWGSNEYSGNGDWTSRNFALNVGGAGPTASFTESATAVDSGQSVSFDASASAGSGGVGISRYQWDLDGDGSFETDTGGSPRAARSYPAPATITVRLRVTDTAGDESVAEQALTVRNRPPVARLSPSASSVPVGQRVFLDGAGSSDPDGVIIRYQWDLNGDGIFETDTGRGSGTPSLALAAPATLTVRLRVTDEFGASGVASAQLRVFKVAPPGPSKQCRAARARLKKLVITVRRLRSQTKHAHGARKRQLARKLVKARRQLASAGVRAHTLC